MTLPGFVPGPEFEDYKERFKNFLIMERRNGIILVRMHTGGGPVKWNFAMHNALAQAWRVIGSDPENEVMILTSTGRFWLAESDRKDFQEEKGDLDYDLRFYDSTKIVENLLFDIDFPTIAAINGPGWCTDLASFCDITVCTEDSIFSDGHYINAKVPGDGQGLIFQGLIGTKRAAYYMYLSKPIDARTALEWGLVNEILPAETLLERAWEIAETIMKQPRAIRRLTSQLVKRPLKRLLMDDFQAHIGNEMFGSKMTSIRTDFNLIRESWNK